MALHLEKIDEVATWSRGIHAGLGLWARGNLGEICQRIYPGALSPQHSLLRVSEDTCIFNVGTDWLALTASFCETRAHGRADLTFTVGIPLNHSWAISIYVSVDITTYFISHTELLWRRSYP